MKRDVLYLTLSYSGYCAEEWIFWLANLNRSIDNSLVRNIGNAARLMKGLEIPKIRVPIIRTSLRYQYKVGEFFDPTLKGEYYIKDGDIMLTRAGKGENPLEKIREYARGIVEDFLNNPDLKLGIEARLRDEVKRSWKSIEADKDAPLKPFK